MIGAGGQAAAAAGAPQAPPTSASAAAAAAPGVVTEQAATPPGARPRAAVGYEMRESEPELSLPQSKAPMLIVASVLGLLFIAGVIGVAIMLFGGGPELSATVAERPEGEVLVVDIAGAADGTKVQLAGREGEVRAGRAEVPIAADLLNVGENELTLALVSPDGDVDQAPLTLTVEYRVHVDLAGLEANPPVLRYRVRARPGATVTLDDHPVTLDEGGHGTYESHADESSEDETLTRVVRVHVVSPDGAAHDGRVSTRVPFAMLRVDRPGESLVTDRDSVEIAGEVRPGSHVTLGDEELDVREGRFVHRLPLPEEGELELTLHARLAGYAPRRRTIRVRRVADLAREAARYEVDRALTYARIAQNPEMYRGRGVSLEGRVYHVDVHEGRSVLQMMVRDCRGGQRCAVWVTYPAATDATVGSWVRVVGDVAGEQAFRPRSGGEVMRVPRVDARFVLPGR